MPSKLKEQNIEHNVSRASSVFNQGFGDVADINKELEDKSESE